MPWRGRRGHLTKLEEFDVDLPLTKVRLTDALATVRTPAPHAFDLSHWAQYLDQIIHLLRENLALSDNWPERNGVEP